MLINENNLKLAFDKFDSNGDGFIDLLEMKNILGNAKEDYLNALIEVIDENND